MPEESLFINVPPPGATCEVHSWPDEGLAHRLFVEMRAKHGKGGVNVCRACLERARANQTASAAEEP